MATQVTADQLLDEVKHMMEESRLRTKHLSDAIESGVAAGEDVSDMQVMLQMYRERKDAVGNVYIRLMEVAQGTREPASAVTG